MDPPATSRALESRTNRHRCRHIFGLVVKASARLRALMTGALLLLIHVSACTALDHVRVWRSRSDRWHHQLRSTLGMVPKCLGSPAQLSRVDGSSDAIRLVMCQQGPDHSGVCIRECLILGGHAAIG
jgi:hypothetical protein